MLTDLFCMYSDLLLRHLMSKFWAHSFQNRAEKPVSALAVQDQKLKRYI